MCNRYCKYSIFQIFYLQEKLKYWIEKSALKLTMLDLEEGNYFWFKLSESSKDWEFKKSKVQTKSWKFGAKRPVQV